MTHTHDDDDWEDLELVKAGDTLPEVTLKISRWSTKKGLGDARSMFAFRREAAAWVRSKATRYRVQVGGRDASRVRIIPDNEGGRFEFSEFKGTIKMSLFRVGSWPNENRDHATCSWKLDDSGAMVLTLPSGFTRATGAPAPQAKPKVVEPPAPQPVRVAVPRPAAEKPGLIGARITDHRTYGTMSMGEPAPGRSALDKRKNEGKA